MVEGVCLMVSNMFNLYVYSDISFFYSIAFHIVFSTDAPEEEPTQARNALGVFHLFHLLFSC